MNLIRSILLVAITILAFAHPSPAGSTPMKIAIIKADDIRINTDKWDRFFAISKEKGVKVSAGIICVSLQGDREDYIAWLKGLHASGNVEFWNHGWDHKRWDNEENKRTWEFSGTGYEHQKKHFEDAQEIMEQVFGVVPVAFGAPFNAFDSDTVKVMEGNADMGLFFCYDGKTLENKLSAPMHLRGESDGSGKPNFEKFREDYLEKKDLSFSAIQFHPNSFDAEHFEDYANILDFLIAEGWTFVTPTEYIDMQ